MEYCGSHACGHFVPNADFWVLEFDAKSFHYNIYVQIWDDRPMQRARQWQRSISYYRNLKNTLNIYLKSFTGNVDNLTNQPTNKLHEAESFLRSQ